MIKKFLEISGISICYYEKNETSSETLFFIHGNSGSARMWQKQFESPMFSDYRLIAFDLPAHGNSGELQDPQDYNLLFISSVLGKAVKALSKDRRYILIGFSLGANLVAEMLAYDMSPTGIVLAGPSIINSDYPFDAIGVEGFDSSLLFNESCSDEMLQAYANATCLSNDKHNVDAIIKDYKKVASPFRSMLFTTAMEGKVSDEIKLLKDQGIPLLIIVGADEKVIKPDYLDNASLPLYNNTIYKLPGASHFVSVDQPDATNKLIADYAATSFTKAHSSSHIVATPTNY